MTALVNWAGNYAYGARRVHRPATYEQLREIVATAPKIRVLGSRHAFHGIGDADELVSLAGVPDEVVADPAAGTVTCPASITYAELAQALHAHGLALHTMASLPHISVGGAVATATHGSGDACGNLATAVAGLELVTSDGTTVCAARGEADFDGMVVGLGALGAVTRLTLDAEPAYEVRQHVFEDLAWEALYERFDEITASGYAVSLFTRWGEQVDQVWVKTRTENVPDELFGARPAAADRHPIPGMDPVNCTPQLGRPGPWWERLPHFRPGFTPSSGEELQSELLLPRRHAVEAIDAVRALGEQIGPLLHICEIRTVAADTLWLSPQHGRDTIGIHFTWRREPEPVVRAIRAVEAALAPFEPRPHWGKLFFAHGRYERLPDFVRLAERLDPRGAFRNDWLEQRVFG